MTEPPRVDTYFEHRWSKRVWRVERVKGDLVTLVGPGICSPLTIARGELTYSWVTPPRRSRADWTV